MRPSAIEREWDREMARQNTPSLQEHSQEGIDDKVDKGESWWGHVLDSALELAPHVIPLVAGMGDYHEDDIANQVLPRSNSLAAAFSDGEMCNEVPAIHNIGSETRFTHREYLGDVYSTTSAFAKIDFSVNPGMNEVFPWASRSLVNYEQYALQGAMFCIETEGSDYAAGPGLGWFACGTSYDVTEPVFTSKKEMFQNQFTSACKISKNLVHWIECNPDVLVMPKKFVRAGAVPAGSDVHLYDHCRTTLAVGGQATGGVAIGELWITYDLVAMFPRSDESNLSAQLYSQYFTAVGTVSAAVPFGSGWTAATRNTFPLALNGNSFTIPDNMPAGTYTCTLEWFGTAQVAAYAVPAVTSATKMTQVTSFTAGTGGGTQGPTGMMRRYTLTTTGENGAIFGVDTSTWVGPTNCGIFITLEQIPRTPTASSPVFDFQGREVEVRYEKMRRALEPTLADIPERETKSFVLARVMDDWYVVHPDTGNRVRVDQQTAKSLTLVSDSLFETMCMELSAIPRDGFVYRTGGG